MYIFLNIVPLTLLNSGPWILLYIGPLILLLYMLDPGFFLMLPLDTTEFLPGYYWILDPRPCIIPETIQYWP